MRSLFILRGSPASGKSTWVKEHNLEAYTLSADQIRRQIQAPVMDENGKYGTCQDNDTEVWALLFQQLEKRMERGDLTIVDATHYKSSLIARYKEYEDKYRYRVYVVDFTNIPEEEILKRNNARREEEIVPDDVISKMIIALKDDSEVKKSYKIITPEEAYNLINSPLIPIDLNEYNKVVIFGDIHGCYEPIKKYFEDNPFNNDTSYIFVGDYIDRGIQNKEVLEFLLIIYKNKNVALLEGNHEKNLKKYSEKNYNLNDYKDEETCYSDLQATKLTNLLKHYIETYTAKANKLKNTADEIYKIKQEENTDEIFYNFEKINAIEKVKEYNEESSKYRELVKKLEYYKTVLNYEKNCTAVSFYNITEFLIENNLPYSLEIEKGILAKYGIKYKDVKGNPIKSAEFINNTLPQIAEIDKGQLRQLCRKFIQLSYFMFKDKEYLVTHGGLPQMPTLKTCTEQIIKGVGGYSASSDIDKKFSENQKGNVIQVHGHRNVFNESAKITDFAYNLNTSVEFGEPLRIMEITDHIEIKEYVNTVFNKSEEKNEIKEKSELEVLRELVSDKYIDVKQLNDNIISLNFSRDAFYSSKWNERTCRARGLFIDKKNGNVAARSFNKFFNWGQLDCVKSPELKKTMVFPVKCWKKENGFLGLISKYNGKIHYFTKSSDSGDYVNWFIGVLCDNYGFKFISEQYGEYTYSDIYDKLAEEEKIFAEFKKQNKDKDYSDYEFLNRITSYKLELDFLKEKLSEKLNDIIEENRTYIFECIDVKNDRHIIKYDKSHVVLLDIVTNDLLKPEFATYKEITEMADKLGVNCKILDYEFNNWEDLYAWRQQQKVSYDVRHEGWVIEDVNGFKVKMKSNFYTFWKQMRGVLNSLQGGKGLKKVYKSKEEILATKIMQRYDREKLKTMDIIDIEDIFYKEYEENLPNGKK